MLKKNLLKNDGSASLSSATTEIKTARNVAAGLLMRQRLADDASDEQQQRFKHQLSFRCFGVFFNAASSTTTHHEQQRFATYSEMIDVVRRIGLATCDAAMRLELQRDAEPTPLITVRITIQSH